MTNIRKELKEHDLKFVTGGSCPDTYDPNTGKGLPVGYFLQLASDTNYYYKITEIDPTDNWYHVVTFHAQSEPVNGTKVLMLLRYDAIVGGRFVPYGDTVPANVIQV